MFGIEYTFNLRLFIITALLFFIPISISSCFGESVAVLIDDTDEEEWNGKINEVFLEEMKATIETVNLFTDTSSVVLPILTDTHMGLDIRSREQLQETIDNLKFFCNNCYSNGVVHLGDLLMSSWNNKLLSDGYTQDDIEILTTQMMSDCLNLCLLAHPSKHLYAGKRPLLRKVA